jgi:hypothetical protein
MRNVAYPLIAGLFAGCGAAPPEQPPLEATLAVMTEIRPGMPLDDMLQRLDAYLVSALEARMDGDAINDFRRAEAISDRLLEARLPFEWITEEQYSLESRLRQIQSRADRVLAQIETGAPRDSMLLDLQGLRTEVVRLRETVARGGTRAPPSIHTLLERGDTAGARRPAQADRPAQPTGPRPIGTPVPPGGGR